MREGSAAKAEAPQKIDDDQAEPPSTSDAAQGAGGFRREVQPRRQHWFLNEKSGFPFRTPAFCSVSKDKDGSAKRNIEPLQ
jgi:hypothetical protein